MKLNLTIEIDDDKKDELVLEVLKSSYRLNANLYSGHEMHECSDDEILNALDLVINYFSTDEQYKQWVEEKECV
jgi:hypothetical protein